jgi:hypothetical protein
MTSGQFWWLILIISIGCGFWATLGVLERLLKGLNAHRDLMHADARDQLAELREISSALSDIRLHDRAACRTQRDGRDASAIAGYSGWQAPQSVLKAELAARRLRPAGLQHR